MKAHFILALDNLEGMLAENATRVLAATRAAVDAVETGNPVPAQGIIDGDRAVVRLTFFGPTAERPLVSQLISSVGTEVNIIAGTIDSVQQQTGHAIHTLEQGNLLMQEGLARNDKVAEALARIDEQSRTAGEQFAVISTATQEQSSTATVLSRNLQSIAQANSEQRDVANELALTARELEGLAAQLRQEVDRFR